MADRVKELLGRVQEWWNKFTSKQKTIIVGSAAAVVLAFVILMTVLSQTKYTLLKNCESTKEASEITGLLDASNVTYQVSDDGLRIEVDEEQISTANLLLGANGYASAEWGIDNVTDGGFSTTESDKQKRYKKYLEKQLENDFLGMFPAIKSASVILDIPENDGTLISQEQESHATIVLEIDGEFTTDNAAFLAKAVANALGNDTTEYVTIIDNGSNLLYSGNDSYSLGGAANSQLSLKRQAEDQFAGEVKKLLVSTGEFTMAEVSPNLDISFTSQDRTVHNFSAPEGQAQGMLVEESLFNSESQSGSGDVPGTDPNTETTYVLPDTANSSDTQTEENRKYAPNEEIINETTPAGSIRYANSSISATGTRYTIIKEEDAKKQGLLEGMSWDEYKAANGGRTRVEVDEELYSVVANATGIPRENITIVKYSENYFVDSEGLGIGVSDIIQIILIIVILGLLGFVVLKSMAGKKEVQPEEELSVEPLLQSPPASELEDIEVETKSETRKMIDKFVDENPEAAANLLRNWLNEDWG